MSAPREHHYDATVSWTGAAAGAPRTYASYSRDHTIVVEGKPDLPGSADPVFRGEASRYNPEELLLAALSACHLLSYLALCEREGIAVVAYVDRASATMQENAGAGRFTQALLRPEVTIDDERVERATALHELAHEQCFIANSVNFPVRHDPTVRRFVPA